MGVRKLSDDDYRKIRSSLASNADIAAEFGIDISTARQIRNRTHRYARSES